MWRTPVTVENRYLRHILEFIKLLRLFFSCNSLFWLGMIIENLWSILHFVGLFTTKSNFNQSCGVKIAAVACFRKELELDLFLNLVETELLIKTRRSQSRKGVVFSDMLESESFF